jgi:hypothetical protein
MLQLLQSVIGTPGPLIVEADGKLFFENCMTIREQHVDNMYRRVKELAPVAVIQTTDRSFSFIPASHPDNIACAPPCRNSTSHV